MVLREFWRAASMALAAISLAVGAGAYAEQVSRPYPVEVAAGFQSTVTLEDVEATALRTLSRPISATIERPGEIGVVPTPPAILRIVGCRGKELSSVDSRVSEVDDEFVWYVNAKGTYSMPHVGEIYAEGYFLVDPRTGIFFRTGIFPPVQ